MNKQVWVLLDPRAICLFTIWPSCRVVPYGFLASAILPFIGIASSRNKKLEDGAITMLPTGLLLYLVLAILPPDSHARAGLHTL
jgi:hypothetical protein